MERESFIFYASFSEALMEMPDNIRLKIYDAICTYALKGIEPDFVGIEKAVFTLIKPQLQANRARYEAGCKGAEYGKLGGRPKKTANEPQTEENSVNENPIKTPPKPHQNPTKTANENENVNENVISPPISPPYGGEGESLKDKFFAKYPALKGKRAKDANIDYGILLAEFERSSLLRGIYTFSKIVAMYEGIKRGDYRDKTASNPALDAVNSKVARERYYAENKHKAEMTALSWQEKVKKKSPRFVVVEREIARLNLELAKAEINEPDKLPELKEEQETLLIERMLILDELGIEPHMLVPQYTCKKCSDSGFLPNGTVCDCYKG